MTENTSSPILRKAAEVLSILANSGELSSAQIAEMTGQARTSVYRLLNSLEALNFIEEGSTRGSYVIGLKLLELGSSVLTRFDERKAARQPLQRLHAATEQTVYLCIRDGDKAVCIDRIEGRWVRSMSMQIGQPFPLHVGVGPRVLLAFQSSNFIAEYLDRNDLSEPARLREQNLLDMRTRDELLAMFSEIRVNGCAVMKSDTVAGMAGISAPIHDYSGRVRASISMSGISEVLLGENRQSYVRQVLDTAQEISRLLGYRENPPPLDTSRHLSWLSV